MKILYIPRQTKRPDFRRALQRYLYPYFGQDGFFLGSLCRTVDVTVRPMSFLKEQTRNLSSQFDWVLINYKAAQEGSYLRDGEISALRDLKALKGCKVALVATNDKARFLPPDSVLDWFDIVFKREHFRDLDRYEASLDNKLKLRTTMLACPLVRLNRIDIALGQARTAARPAKTHAPRAYAALESDVFFLGESTNKIRENVVGRLKREGLNFLGGIQYRHGRTGINQDLAAERIKMSRFADAMRSSKINLALEGYGEFTHRHLEIWCLSSFMISSPSLRELRLPMNVEEGLHYVSFDSTDDLIDKVRYYLDRPQERARIAEAGAKEFWRCYDFEKHGQYIKACLENRASTEDAA